MKVKTDNSKKSKKKKNISKLKKAYDMLLQLEWLFAGEQGHRYCPICSAWESEGHTRYCELNKLIVEIEKCIE